MPQWVGLVLTFAMIVVLVNRMVPLGLAMLAGSMLLGLTLGMGVLRTLAVAAAALVSPPALDLALLMALITLLNHLLQEFGLLRDMIDALTGLVRSTRLAIVAAPSIVGFLPVPGAAIVSAPLVDALGNRLELPPPVKAAANLVFRHAWFFVFPFMPSLILAARLAETSVYQLARLQFPLTLAVLAAGYLAYFRGRPREQPQPPETGLGTLLWTFLVKGSPLLVGLSLSLVFGLPMPVSLAVGVALALFLGRKHPRFRPRLLWRGIDYWMVLAMPAIIAFREVVSEAGVIAVMVSNLVGNGLPLVGLAFVLPVVIGFVSASQSTTIGITYPLLLPLVEPAARPALAVLMFTSSFAAYVISPLHLCQILTLEYFKTRLGAVYRQYLVPMTAVLLTAWVLVWLYLR